MVRVIMATVMMAAVGLGTVGQAVRQQGLDRSVRVAGDPGVQGDARLCQCVPGAHTQAAADQGLHAGIPQKARQRAVSAAVGVQDLCPRHPAVFHLVHLELLRVAKVLKHGPVLIGHCDFHDETPPISAFWGIRAPGGDILHRRTGGNAPPPPPAPCAPPGPGPACGGR